MEPRGAKNAVRFREQGWGISIDAHEPVEVFDILEGLLA
jgi:hypothetical protein